MTTVPSRHRRRAPLAGLGITLISTWILPAATNAAGFYGSFAPEKWLLMNEQSGGLNETYTSPDYLCPDTNTVACIDTFSPNSVDVVGSVSGSPRGGTVTGTPRITTWTVTNVDYPSTLKFRWSFSTNPPGVTTQTASYVVGAVAYTLASTDTPVGGILTIDLAPHETFGFRVTTSDNSSDLGILSISEFTSNTSFPVPGPLPLAGAAAAFAWSRRLRHRIR